jgi:hypothetical protein
VTDPQLAATRASMLTTQPVGHAEDAMSTRTDGICTVSRSRVVMRASEFELKAWCEPVAPFRRYRPTA